MPPALGALIGSREAAVFATRTALGQPIGQLLTPFAGSGGETIDITTGLAYASKARRVRACPQTGFLFESRVPGGPVAVVAAHGAVRDADLQLATDRYVDLLEDWAGDGSVPPVWEQMGASWEQARQAVWYLPRLWVENRAVTVWWWPERCLDHAPQVWRAPATTSLSASDPAPPPLGAAAKMDVVSRPPVDWAERARPLDPGPVGYLTFIGPDGTPLPVRARAFAASEAGFVLELDPWPAATATAGPACLHIASASGDFGDAATFVGRLSEPGARCELQVERVLDGLELATDPGGIWDPSPAVRAHLCSRVEAELARRGQPMPRIRRSADRR